MANKKISNSSLFDGDVFKKTRDDGEALLAVLDRIEERQRDILKTSQAMAQSQPMEGYDNIKKIEGELKKVEAANEALLQIEKERIKLSQQIEKRRQAEIKLQAQQERASQKANKALEEQDKIKKKLNDSTSEAAQETALLREQLRRQNKELRDNAKATLDADDAYRKLLNETNKAQLEFKRLAAEFGTNSEEAGKAFEAFDKLDSRLRAINDRARDGRRDVGRYQLAYQALKEDVSKADAELKEVIATFGENSKEAKKARRELRKLNDRLKSIEDAAKDAREGVSRLEKGFKKLDGTLGKLGILAIFIAAFEKMSELFKTNTEGTDSFNKALNRIFVPLQVFTNGLVNIAQNAGTIFNNFLISAQIKINEFKASFLDFTNVFGSSKVDEKIKKLAEENETLAKSYENVQNPFENFSQEVEERLETLDKAIDLTTKYSKENAALTKQIAELRKEQLSLQTQADDDTQSFEKQLEALQRLGEVSEQVSQKQLKILENEATVARLRARGNAQSVDLQNEALLAEAAVIEAQAEQQAAREERERARLVILRDQFEQELDLLFDVSDRRKTINERIVADETKTFEERRKALDAVQKDIANTYQEIENTFNEFVEGDPIDFQELLSIEDTKEFQERVDELRKEFNLNEITINRLREARIELDAATNDLSESERDLIRAEEEGAKIRQDILLLEEALNKSLEEGSDLTKINEELTEKRLQGEIDALRESLKVAEQGSLEFLKIQRELDEKLLAQQTKQNNERVQKEKETQERVQKVQEAGFAIVSELIKKQNTERLEQIDGFISRNEERIAQLQKANEANTEEALSNLAFEEKRRAELERARGEQVRRAQRLELALAAVESFSSKVAAGKSGKEAIAETLTEVTLLQQLVSSLPSFYEGKDVTGKGNVDDKGGFLSVLHPNEIVLSEENRKSMLGNPMSRREIIDTFNFGAMALSQRPPQSFAESQSLESLKKSVMDVERAIKSQPANLGMDYEKISQVVIDIIKRGNKIEKVRNKIKGIF